MPAAVPEDPELTRRRRSLVLKIANETASRAILEMLARGEIFSRPDSPSPAGTASGPTPGVLDLPPESPSSRSNNSSSPTR